MKVTYNSSADVVNEWNNMNDKDDEIANCDVLRDLILFV